MRIGPPRTPRVPPAPAAPPRPAPAALSRPAPVPPSTTPLVTVCITYYKCKPYLRRAVDSILAQTFTDFKLVVINDGDPDEPWDVLADITDPRLTKFTLPENKGTYFANAVVLEACDSKFFLIQDADDWSEPNRLELLVGAIGDAAFAGSLLVKDDGTVVGNSRRPMDAGYTHRHYHIGLHRVDTLRALGGYYNGHRTGFDTLLMNLVEMTGKIVTVQKPLYHWCRRADSLTHSAKTGLKSAEHQRTRAVMAEKYAEAYRAVTEEKDCAKKSILAQRAAQSGTTEEDKAAVRGEAVRLRGSATTENIRHPRPPIPPVQDGWVRGAWPLVTVSIPCYKCRQYIRQAVDSILAQTFTDFKLVVVNDGDPDEPWDVLADITDPRLVRFTLPENKGHFFAHATVLDATDSKYFLVQDADDWSESSRLEMLVDVAEKEGAAFAGSQIKKDDGTVIAATLQPITPAFEHRYYHTGLHRISALKSLGGYYGGYRIGFDSLLMNAVAMTGYIALVAKPLYVRRVREESLTTSKATGVGSLERRRVRDDLGRAYVAMHQIYERNGGSRPDEAVARVREVLQRETSEQDRLLILRESARLRLLAVDALPTKPRSTWRSVRAVDIASGRSRIRCAQVCDVRNWAFDVNLRAMARYLAVDADFDFWYIVEKRATNADWSELRSRDVAFTPFHRWSIDDVLPTGRVLGSLRSQWFKGEAPAPPCDSDVSLVNSYAAFHVVTRPVYNALRSVCPRVVYLTNPVDTQMFRPLPKSPSPIVASFGGNAVRSGANDHKGLNTITRPACKMAGVPLEVAEYQTGRVSHHDMPAWYAKTTVGMYMSTHEGASNSVMESMAMGLAVVTTDCGNHREMQESQLRHFGDTGIVIIDRTVHSAAWALSMLKSNPKRVAEMGEINRLEIQERWSWTVWTNRYRDFLLSGLR